MTTRDIGTAKLLTPNQKCSEHAVTFQDSIGLPSTDDPMKGEKVANFKFSKSTKKKKLFPAGRSKKLKGEYHNPREVIFSAKHPLNFC